LISFYNLTMFYILLALLSAALFGAATPLSKALLVSFDPFQLAGLLYLGAAIGAATMAFKKGQTQPWRMDTKNIFRLSGAILCGGVMAPLFLLLGLKAASAASVSLWLPLELVATAVLGRLLFRDHLGKFGWLGMFGVVAASVLLSIGEGSAGIRAGVLILLACACWGFDNNFTALIDGITPAQSTFWKGIVAGTINLGIGLAIHDFDGSTATTFSALGVGVFSYGASIVLYITAAQNIGAARGQMFFASSPFFGVLLSAIFLGESISTIQFIAVACLSGSLVLVFRDRHEHQHHHEKMDHEHSHRHDDEHHFHVHPGATETLHHTHRHQHEPIKHAHPHWPDLHHRHNH
jgi:drug/metabolite transporter (DMT)-like permease